jgi:cardiolipin synthase
MFLNLPNLVTVFRILLVPVVVGLFYIDKPLSYLLAAGLFIVACLTDFLDGYLARSYDQVTAFGSFLDPLADKLLIASVLLMLAGFQRLEGLSLIPAIIIICREILVSGLREMLGKVQAELPVTPLAQLKTAVQMLSIALLIIADPDSQFRFAYYIGLPALWIAAFLTLASGYDYLKKSFQYMRGS